MDSSSSLRHHDQTASVMDVSAVLWTVVRPTNRTVDTYSYLGSRNSALCLFEADAHHALLGMMTILPKVLLGQLKTLLLGSTSWTLKHHCQMEMKF